MSERQLVAFAPEETLVFTRGGNSSVDGSASAILTLTLGEGLQSGMDVVFRIQTTSPATYRVKPSNGRLKSSAPVATIEITMTSTPVKADKFLVKYAAVPESQVEDSAKLLAEAGAAVQDRRLKVQVIEENTVVPSQGLVEDQSPLAKAQAKIEELTLALKVAQDALKNKQSIRQRLVEEESSDHPATELKQGLSEAELSEMIKNQAGFPPVLVILIALFSFLVGLLF